VAEFGGVGSGVMLQNHFDKLKEGKRAETAEYEMTYRLNSTVPATYSCMSSVPVLTVATDPLPFSRQLLRLRQPAFTCQAKAVR
jgi:hypothetical protein